jgi:Mg2+ and Co2+ transporter CorA
MDEDTGKEEGGRKEDVTVRMGRDVRELLEEARKRLSREVRLELSIRDVIRILVRKYLESCGQREVTAGQEGGTLFFSVDRETRDLLREVQRRLGAELGVRVTASDAIRILVRRYLEGRGD